MVKMQVLQLAQTECREQIAAIVARHLVGDYSDSLTRFSYINGAEDFLRFIHTPDYFGYTREFSLINRITPQISRRIRNNSQIIDLGPGDGQKAIRILTNLSGRISNYLALDISRQMLNVAQISQNRIQSVAKKYRLCDFSNMPKLRLAIRTGAERDRIFLLLGNTLTNEVNIGHFLQNFREIADETNGGKNYLLLGLELLSQDINQIVREYRSEENYILTFRPLEMLGINRQDGVIDISFNESLRRIEEQFIFTRPTTIIVNSHCINFSEGDRILLSVTCKPALNEIIGLVRSAGWNLESMEFEENQAILLLSSKEIF